MFVRPVDFTTLVYDLLVYRDFDFIAIGLTNLGRYVDWTHAMLHSSNDVPWGWNFVGIADEDFDNWTEIILTSLNETEIIEAASKLQQKFVYEVMPWFPTITGLEFCTLAREADPPAGRGELMNLISMPNYGPSNDWSYMTLHWNYSWPGGAIRRVMGDEAKELNPWTDNTAYSWDLMNRAIVGLLAVSPITLKNMPFIATKWHIENWTSIPELGIEEGATAQFHIRQDVTWHDGRPVTAYDCVANMRFIREYKPGRYSRVWNHLVYEEADGPYKFNVYFDQTSLYYADFVAR
ncbi:MAG: hypothetical protein GWO08_08210, partial [Gammaproteobacteria bacterium]|nr:hypothetical protein [Gammaproteobacteria bacterium]